MSLPARFWHDHSGNYIVLVALLLPLLIGSLGIAIDIGTWLYAHQAVQGAADLAAFSAATATTNRDAISQANAIAASNGFINNVGGVTVTVNIPPKSGAYMKSPTAIEVIVRQPQPLYFADAWVPEPILVSGRAVAVANAGLGCVLTLNSSADGAASLKGNSTVTLKNCSLYNNSSHPSALSLGGTATLSALTVSVVGGISGASRITTTAGTITKASPTADPYADVVLRPVAGCDQNDFSAKTTVTIYPGVYCGGMDLNSGAAVTLTPGLYFIDGGSLAVNGGAHLTGSGVTLVFTSYNKPTWAVANINANAAINLTAPSSGPTAGIVIFGDRNMPVGKSFKFNGGAIQTFGGAVYLPKADIDWAGGTTTTTQCTQIVANTISFSGTSNLAVDCSALGTRPIGTGTAILVE